MVSIEQEINQGVKDDVLPGAVLFAKDKSGRLNYAKAIGTRSIGEDAKPLELNSVLFLASMTKLLTSIAAMQVVEKGLISLDDDISSLLPELAKQPILHGFDESGKPITSERKSPIKFVHLLTHSSGATYELMDPHIPKYRAFIGDTTDRATMETKSGFPLRFEPGTYWSYGTGTDWAGRVVERLTGENLQTYMQKNMFVPLGIKRIAFSPHLTPEMQEDVAKIADRDPESGRMKNRTAPGIADNDTDCFGGHGCYADLTDYVKILDSILNDDEVLLKRESTAEMFRPQLTSEAKKGLNTVIHIPEIHDYFIGGLPDTVTYDWGVGGILLDTDDTATKRKKGTLLWSGMPNLFWFIDREAGLYGAFGTQVFPPGDKQVARLINAFEKEVYEMAGVA